MHQMQKTPSDAKLIIGSSLDVPELMSVYSKVHS
jgi:hypothetical protein